MSSPKIVKSWFIWDAKAKTTKPPHASYDTKKDAEDAERRLRVVDPDNADHDDLHLVQLPVA